MAVIVDKLGIVIKGNLPKSFDGKETTLKMTREQLDDLIAQASLAKQIFADTSPTPVEEKSSAAPPTS